MREWNADSYHQVSTPQFDWGLVVLDRLSLEGHELVFDIGCGTGRLTEKLLERLPHGRVVGIDSDPHYLRQAEFAADKSGLDIEFKQMSVYDVGSFGEKFDLVIFMGVLYHLRHPLLALDLLY